jgi:hypothetical protein
MDRIAAMRNVEDALVAFEEGEMDLEGLERQVQGILRTYATDFEAEDLAPYRASGDGVVEGMIVVATSQAAAKSRVTDLVDDVSELSVERIE